MTIESVVILVVGFGATMFLLSFSWWLWTLTPTPPLRDRAPGAASPTSADQWMDWAQPGVPSAPPSPERELFEQSTLTPIFESMPNPDGELDKARTMFFVKADPAPKIVFTPLELECEQTKAPPRRPPPLRK
jgi:hypothetical protein